MNPTVGRNFYRWFVALLPLITGLLIVLRTQIAAREFDLWTLGDSAIGLTIALLGTLVAAQAGIARAGTETAEAKAEIATNRDADDDKLVEQPAGGTGVNINSERGDFNVGGTGILGLIAVILIIIVAVVWLWLNLDVSEDPAAILSLLR